MIFVHSSTMSEESATDHHTHLEMTCLYCDFNFTNRSQFKEHVCNTSYGNEKAYTIHLEEKGSLTFGEDDVEMSCLYCEESFASPTQMREHQCSSCKVATGDSGLDQDLELLQEFEASCLYCGKCFSSQGQLNDHECSTETQPRESADVNHNLDIVDSLSDTSETLNEPEIACLYCAKKFSCQSALNEHECLAEDQSPPNQVSLTDELQQSENEGHGDLVMDMMDVNCLYCRKTFVYPDQLNEHRCTIKEKQLQPPPFQQPEGDQASSQNNVMDQGNEGGAKQASSAHQEDSTAAIKDQFMSFMAARPFMCNICFKRFKKLNFLKNHQRAHSDEQVSCLHCFRTFRSVSGLTQHAKTHGKDFQDSVREGIWPYACGNCDKKFKTSNQLENHEKYHSAPKQFVCAHCQIGFPYRRELNKHMKSHTQNLSYSCSKCNKKFSQEAEKNKHEMKHSDEKAYKCGSCGKGFRSKNGLRQHQSRQHPTEILFKCSFCEQNFPNVSQRNNHEKGHLEDQPIEGGGGGDLPEMSVGNVEDEDIEDSCYLRSDIKTEMMNLDYSYDNEDEGTKNHTAKYGDFLREITTEPM